MIRLLRGHGVTRRARLLLVGLTLAALAGLWLYLLVAHESRILAAAAAVGMGMCVFRGGVELAGERVADLGTGHLVSLVGTALAVPSVLLGIMSQVPFAKAPDDTGSPVPVDKEVLRQGLLVPEDLPDGWGYIPPGRLVGPQGLAAQHYCGEPTLTGAAPEEEAALAEPDHFLRESESVFSVVAAFRNEPAAAQFLEQVEESTRCGTWAPGGEGLTYVVTPRPELAEDLGDEALWLELSNQGGGPQTAVHVYVRSDRVVGLVVYNVPHGGEPTLDPVDLARRKAEKLSDVASRLD